MLKLYKLTEILFFLFSRPNTIKYMFLLNNLFKFFYQLNNARFSSFLLGRGLVPGPIGNGRKKTGPARAPGPTKKAGRASHRAAPIRAVVVLLTPLAGPGPGHARPGAPRQTRTKNQRKGRRSRRSEVSLPSPAINQQTDCVPDLALFIPWPPVAFFDWQNGRSRCLI